MAKIASRTTCFSETNRQARAAQKARCSSSSVSWKHGQPKGRDCDCQRQCTAEERQLHFLGFPLSCVSPTLLLFAPSTIYIALLHSGHPTGRARLQLVRPPRIPGPTIEAAIEAARPRPSSAVYRRDIKKACLTFLAVAASP